MITLAGTSEATYINADKLHFTNVIHNVIDNALKYCAQVPEVIIKVAKKERNLILEIKTTESVFKKSILKISFRNFIASQQETYMM